MFVEASKIALTSATDAAASFTKVSIPPATRASAAFGPIPSIITKSSPVFLAFGAFTTGASTIFSAFGASTTFSAFGAAAVLASAFGAAFLAPVAVIPYITIWVRYCL